MSGSKVINAWQRRQDSGMTRVQGVRGRECTGGALDRCHAQQPACRSSPLTSVLAAGRNGAAHDAVCVEVLKTSAGLGLSLDGGRSSASGDGPLLIKRVYKGTV